MKKIIKQFVSVSGVCSPLEMERVEFLDSTITLGLRGIRVCAGIQASWTTQGLMRKNSYGYFPVGDEITPLFYGADGIGRIVHINTDGHYGRALHVARRMLCATMPEKLASGFGQPKLDGLQFNQFDPYRRDTTLMLTETYEMAMNLCREIMIIIQLGASILGNADAKPESIANNLDPAYGVLLDASGGQGAPLDPQRCHEVVDAIYQRHQGMLHVVLAGGLDGDNLADLAGDLLQDYPLSIDAQGRLMTAKPRGLQKLSLQKVENYLASAATLLNHDS